MPSATVHVVLSPPSRALPGRHMLRSRHSCARATPIISVRLGTWLGECWSSVDEDHLLIVKMFFVPAGWIDVFYEFERFWGDCPV